MPKKSTPPSALGGGYLLNYVSSTSSSHKARGGDDARKRDHADQRNSLSRYVTGGGGYRCPFIII